MSKQEVETPVVHCWVDGLDHADGCGTSCMLPEGHQGPHEWTRDDEIIVTFPDREKRKR